MKKRFCAVLIVLLACALCAALCACNKDDGASAVYLVFDGDIAGGAVSLNLQNYPKEPYSYDDDGETVNTEGWNLTALLQDVEMLCADNHLMITSAADGVSAMIEANLTGTIFVYQNDEGKLCTKGVDYPRAVGIKDISEITVVSKTPQDVDSGIKILTVQKTEVIGFGAAKMKLFRFSVENTMGNNKAYKYLPADDRTVSSFTGRENNAAYFCDFDIQMSTDNKTLSWRQGNLYLDNKAVFGFATNAQRSVMDAYNAIKAYIDSGEKVMFILPDGFSWQQATEFEDDLDALKASRAEGYAVSTHPAISPVALASIVTGETPYATGIHFDEGESRAVLKPNAPDIFEYAVSQGKSVGYLEGSGNLIITSTEPVYGLSDNQTYENAKTAIAAGKDLIFVHFHEIDDQNHGYGALSEQSKAKCIVIDSYIADLRAQFDGIIIIVPDHGHVTLSDSNNNAYGKHGMFTNLDMYVPFFVYE